MGMGARAGIGKGRARRDGSLQVCGCKAPIKVQVACVVLVDLIELLLQILLVDLVAKGTHHDVEILSVDGPGALLVVLIEQIERVLYLSQLILCELLLPPVELAALE